MKHSKHYFPNKAPNIAAKPISNTIENILSKPCDALIIGVFTPLIDTIDTVDTVNIGSKKHKKAIKNTAKHNTTHETIMYQNIIDTMAPPISLAVLKALDLTTSSLNDLPKQLSKTHTIYPDKHSVVKAKRIVCVGLGDKKDLNIKHYSQALRSALNDCTHIETVLIGINDSINENDVELNTHNKAKFALQIAHEISYQYEATLSQALPKYHLTTVLLPVESIEKPSVIHSIIQGSAIGQGINFAKEMGNLPANICTPTYLAKQAKLLAKQFNLDCTILKKKALHALNMGSFLSVTAGSDEPPRLIILKHMGGKADDAPYVLVGKGVTFDTGGISLKPAESMQEMKYDMCGAASILGIFHAIAYLNLPINIIGVIAATENMPSGKATKPGDVVTSMSGKTIEILNTDAEGRLILCDALTYVEQFKPAAVIDIATLTGACVIALGHVHSGLFCNHLKLTQELLSAGLSAQDTAWSMPMNDDYHSALNSSSADMANIGSGRVAGSVVAACFLSKFTQSYPWAHLDIAGTAWKSATTKGATGRPVALLTHYLLNRVNKQT